MQAALAALDPLRPRSDKHLGLGATLALLAHGGLLGALALGLNWRLPQTVVATSAELWAAVPQAAAPAPVAPPPVPPPPPRPAPAPLAPPPAPAPAPLAPAAAEREAAIALEQAAIRQRAQDAAKAQAAREAKAAREAQAAREQAERQRQAEEQARARQREQQAKADKAEKAAKAEEAQRQKAAAAQRERDQREAEAKVQEAQLARQREENLKRMMGQAGATGAANATGSAARDAAPSAAYAGRIKAFIKPNIVLAGDVPGNPVTEVEVKLAPDGSVISRRISKPSGNTSWDNIVLRAIDKTATLPRDTDGRVPPVMLLVFPRQE